MKKKVAIIAVLAVVIAGAFLTVKTTNMTEKSLSEKEQVTVAQNDADRDIENKNDEERKVVVPDLEIQESSHKVIDSADLTEEQKQMLIIDKKELKNDSEITKVKQDNETKDEGTKEQKNIQDQSGNKFVVDENIHDNSKKQNSDIDADRNNRSDSDTSYAKVESDKSSSDQESNDSKAVSHNQSENTNNTNDLNDEPKHKENSKTSSTTSSEINDKNNDTTDTKISSNTNRPHNNPSDTGKTDLERAKEIIKRDQEERDKQNNEYVPEQQDRVPDSENPFLNGEFQPGEKAVIDVSDEGWGTGDKF